jgi:quinohemoprotein ethanol dehydrogenase
MFVRKLRGLRVWLLGAALGVSAIPITMAQQASSVDDAALKAAGRSGQEWISYNANWAEQRYSPLDQINAANVSRLGLAWYLDIPAAPGHPQTHQEGTPLEHNGILYNIAPWSVVYAVDARSGKELWRSDPEVNQEIWQSRICCGVVNRGIALYKDTVIAPVVDGRLRALDLKTGKIAWETRVSPANMPYTITMAPRVIKGGKVIVGMAGGEYAVRGFFAAIDANTGKLAWKFYTVPGDPSKPFEQPELAEAAKTWTGEWWKLGGGAAVWGGVAYDPETDLVYVGTGQPGPWTEQARGAGDSLFSNCILAVRGATGKLVWYYQEVPGDVWDLDSIADLMLLDLPINGRTRKVIIHAPKNGFFYVLDRHTGELLSAEPWVTVNWSSGVNLKTGRPVINPEARYGKGKEAADVMPGPGGGHVWPPWSYNPGTGLVYIPSTIGRSYAYLANPDFTPSPTDVGPTGHASFNMGTSMARRPANGATGAHADVATAASQESIIPSIGPKGEGNILVAWDPVTQQQRWRGISAGFNQGGTLASADLVFSSVNNRLLVYRADNGDQLLDLDTHLSQMGPPMTFMLDGKQYIVITGGPPGPGMGFGSESTGTNDPRRPSRMLVFALDGKAALPEAPPPAASGN